MTTLFWLLTVYGILALLHILTQMWVGHLEHRRQKHPVFRGFHQNHYEKVTVIIPTYNEDVAILRACVGSILQQRHRDLEVIVVDDGSRMTPQLQGLYREMTGKNVHVIMSERNAGKRNAQKLAFDVVRGDILVTIDSDTILHSPEAISQIVKRFKNPRVGAVTGDVRVENKKRNFLTRLVSYRYWTAFHQERAAQGYYSVLMCCSGPFSAYRKSIVDQVKEQYVSQFFLGKNCTYGDDRHLTNLILEKGYQVVFDNQAIAYTFVPEKLRDYLKQQVRWNKSFYREMLWTFKFFHRHHFYMIYDLLMQFILPFLLLAALIAMIYQAAFIDIRILWQYLAVLIGIALLRSLYGIYRTRDFGFLVFVAYGFLHVFLLIPTRIYALATLSNTKWGTR